MFFDVDSMGLNGYIINYSGAIEGIYPTIKSPHRVCNMYIYIYVYTYIHVYICIYRYIYMYIYDI